MHAIVVGAGMAGLTAASVLAEHCERVVVLDRDELDGGATARRAVPQGHHLHLLLTTGFRALRELFPGLPEELRAAGALALDVGQELRYRRRGGLKQPFSGDLHTVAVSRPTLEALVRRRVSALPNVELRGRSPVARLHAEGHRITQVELEGGERLAAELVVDAGGRASRIATYLEALGWAMPPATEIGLGLAYASRFVRLADDPERSWKVLYVGPAAGTWTRGGAIMRVEGERAIVTLAGYGRDHPPLDDAGFSAFAAELGEEFAAALRTSAPLTTAHRFNIPAMRRHHFEAQAQHPVGLLVIGDALCMLDPAYGQGMSVAAEEARLLRALLRERTALEGLARPFYRGAKRIIDRAWVPTLLENFRRPGVEGKRPVGLGPLQWYVGHVMELADRHPHVHEALEESLHMTAGPLGLLRPAVLRRVLARAVGFAG